MTTITTDRARLEELLGEYWEIAFDESSGVAATGNKANRVLHEIRALFDALAAPATAPEKTVKEIMEFARHYAADTFSSATLEDKIRRSLAAPATALEPVAWLARYVGRSGMEQEYVSTDKTLADENDASGKAQPLYLHPPATAPERKPMTDQDTLDLFNRIQLRMRFTDADARPFASGVASAEFFHGIKDKP